VLASGARLPLADLKRLAAGSPDREELVAVT
jgi:hypothetical protein